MPYKDPEQKKERDKKYYQNNKERLKEQIKEYRQNNKEQISKHRKEYRQNNKEQIKERRYKKIYNLALEEIDQILIAQNHKCPICGTSLIETRRCVDHEHKTDKVRGILCENCNVGLGQFKDNPKFLRNAALYVEENK